MSENQQIVASKINRTFNGSNLYKDVMKTESNEKIYEDELERRRNQVWNVCVKNHLQNKGEPNAWEFFIDNKHNIVWCNIFKAASSVWMYNFNLLGGYSPYFMQKSFRVPLIVHARLKFPRPTVNQLNEALKNSLSFIIVRDPFERLLSAYRDKIEGFRNKFYKRIGRFIVFKYRTEVKPSVTQVSDIHSRLKKKQQEIGPTFSEFINYVSDSTTFDEHWAPYHSFCTPCHVNFTVIAKTETLLADSSYIIKKLHLENKLKHQSWKAINKAYDGRNTKDLLPKYFKQLTSEQLNKLLSVYRLDFELFDYDSTKYYNMVMK